MDALLIILLLILVIAAAVAYFISKSVYRQLELVANKHPKTISVVTFIVCFLIIAFAILLLLLYIFPFER